VIGDCLHPRLPYFGLLLIFFWCRFSSDQKVDELAVRVDALNDDFAKQCKSFEDVNAMMDKKIADLKDFVSGLQSCIFLCFVYLRFFRGVPTH
jgi:hypothetical protein